MHYAPPCAANACATPRLAAPLPLPRRPHRDHRGLAARALEELVVVEGVQRLAPLQHDVIRHVHHVADRPHAGVGEALPHPRGRRLDGHELRLAFGQRAGLVDDEGIGLVGEERARLWERFFRGERCASNVSGSGLGLWIAKAFVTANGGEIEASSEGAGRGTLQVSQ